jgi:hypothetical protein
MHSLESMRERETGAAPLASRTNSLGSLKIRNVKTLYQAIVVSLSYIEGDDGDGASRDRLRMNLQVLTRSAVAEGVSPFLGACRSQA